MAYPAVSVVIPAYNAQDTIGPAIQAVLAQDYAGAIELIVVDDGSRDGTSREVLACPRARYVRQENAGPASARNTGAALACGDVLLFTDADCSPEAGWIRKMVAGFSSEGIGAVAGSYGIANAQSILARCIHAEIVFRHRHLMPEFPRAFGSYNVAIRKKVFDGVGGFNADYRRASGEDNDLSYRVVAAGYKIRFQRDALVAHVHQEDLRAYLREQARHGFWRVKMYCAHPQMAAGDDYTFWKDIVEVPWTLGHGLIFVFPGAFFVAGSFFVFEIVWGLFMAGAVKEGIVLGLVMWLRAMVRTGGFLAGIMYSLKISFKR